MNKDKLDKFMNDPELLEKTFKLIDSKNTQTSNMHLFDADGVITKYQDPNEILRDYYIIRLIYYEKRYNYLIEKFKKDLEILNAKMRFIQGVMDEDIIVFRKDTEDIEEQLEERKLPRIEDSYDYLTNMSIRNFTNKKIDELKKQIDNKRFELEVITKKTFVDLWLEDLDKLEEVLYPKKTIKLKIKKKVKKV